MDAEAWTKYREQVATRLRLTLEAQAITLRLCRKSGLVPGYEWLEQPRPYSTIEPRRSYTGGRPPSHRTPPLPFHSMLHKGAGFCRVCGQPVYGKRGSHLAKFGESKRTWHDVCVTTYLVMTKPNGFDDILVLRQQETCPVTGITMALGAYRAEVDHVIPLYRIGRDHRDEPWYELLRFWLLPNLQALSRAAHVAKCADEARERAGMRGKTTGQEAML